MFRMIFMVNTITIVIIMAMIMMIIGLAIMKLIVVAQATFKGMGPIRELL